MPDINCIDYCHYQKNSNGIILSCQLLSSYFPAHLSLASLPASSFGERKKTIATKYFRNLKAKFRNSSDLNQAIDFYIWIDVPR